MQQACTLFLPGFLRPDDHVFFSSILAQCLYVLTDANYSIINEVRSCAPYVSTLMQIVTTNDSHEARAEPLQQDRLLSLRVSAAGHICFSYCYRNLF